jgi:hypothetical protein
MTHHLDHAKRLYRCAKHGCDNDTGNVRDGNHIDGVGSVETGGKLNAAFRQANEEVVCVRCYKLLLASTCDTAIWPYR